MGGRGSSSSTSKASMKQKPPQTGHLSYSEIPKTPAATAAYIGVTESKAKELYASVQSFTGSGYTSIRKAQNGVIKDDWAKKAGENCESYIKNAPKWAGGTTYRGINVSKDTADMFTKGAIIDINMGTASWSTDLSVSKSFAGHGNQVKVVFKCETQSLGTSIKHMSHFTSESEVLVSKNAKYVVTGRRKQGSYIMITVKESK